MTKADDWFRNDRWDAAEEAAFFKRLSRCRSSYAKAQNARIKASGLAHSGDPVRVRAAINLLTKIVNDWPVDLELSCCHWQLAGAHARLGDLDQAIDSFRRCFEQERRFPNARTNAWSDFAAFVVDRRLRHLYDDALGILKEYEKDARFRIDRFVQHGARALIAAERGEAGEARREAEAALQEAASRDSRMAKHPDVGLVGAQHRWIERLRQLLKGS